MAAGDCNVGRTHDFCAAAVIYGKDERERRALRGRVAHPLYLFRHVLRQRGEVAYDAHGGIFTHEARSVLVKIFAKERIESFEFGARTGEIFGRQHIQREVLNPHRAGVFDEL